MYQLTDFQFHKLTMAVESDSVVFVMPAPLSDDLGTSLADALEEAFAEELEQVNDLVELGLVTNVSGVFARTLIEASTRVGRPYEAFMLTEAAVSLFCGDSGAVN